MPEYVQLITEIGGQTLVIGQCLPAQARILEKKGHAAWRDGKLALAIRPIHLAVAVNHKKLDQEGDEVSNAELGRRLDWLRTVMMAVVQTDTHGSDLAQILGYHLKEGLRQPGPRDVLNAILLESSAEAAGFQRVLDNLGPPRLQFSNLTEADVARLREHGNDELPEEEVDEYFRDRPDLLLDHTTDEEMVRLWGATEEESERLALAFANRYGPSSYPPITRSVDDDLPVYTDEDLASIRVLAVHFSVRGKRHHDPTEKTEHRSCPTCGMGEDTDDDCMCAVCGPLLRPR